MFIQIWDINKRKPVNYCPTESDYWMIDLAFSPDGSTIVTLCDSIEVHVHPCMIACTHSHTHTHSGGGQTAPIPRG